MKLSVSTLEGIFMLLHDLFLCCRYPCNNALHHHVESIIYSCLESKNNAMTDHLLMDCNLVGKILQAEKNPTLGELNQVGFPR